MLQFGSGRFIRAFVDAFVHQANVHGPTTGRVVIVQSTGAGRSNLLDEQDGLFTLCVQGIQDGEEVDAYRLVASISRALPAKESWAEVLTVARQPALTVVLSNTTEVGLTFDADDRIDLDPPRSFPGKLTACLYARYRAFDGDPSAGLVVIPCELVEDNGDVLRGLVEDMAAQWDLGPGFDHWLRDANVFCNTLVDRIVTGRPNEAAQAEHEARLGYRDELLTIAEPYQFWAIEGEAALRDRLPWAAANPHIVIADDITRYRERKVRILNGAHTSMVPLAYLAGNDTVVQSMDDSLVSRFVHGVLEQEVLPSMELPEAEGQAYTQEVVDRFRNPFLQHDLLSIANQQTTKLRHRVLPSVVQHVQRVGVLPERLLFGFAAYLRFMRATIQPDGAVTGQRDGEAYVFYDQRADALVKAWQDIGEPSSDDVADLVETIGRREDLWGTDLTRLDGFVQQVSTHLQAILHEGVRPPLERLLAAT